MSLNGQGASQRRQAQRAAQQSLSHGFLLDVSCPGESVEDSCELQVGERISPDLALASDFEARGCLQDGGAHGYLLPLARAPGL